MNGSDLIPTLKNFDGGLGKKHPLVGRTVHIDGIAHCVWWAVDFTIRTEFLLVCDDRYAIPRERYFGGGPQRQTIDYAPVTCLACLAGAGEQQ